MQNNRLSSNRRHILRVGVVQAVSGIVPKLGLGALVGSRANLASASELPKTITLLSGFPPGSAVDYVARQVADRLQREINATVVVSNRSGASGQIALGALKAGKPDGSLLCLVPSSGLTLFPHVYRTLAYDPGRDFTYIAGVCQYYCGIVSATTAPFKTLQEFLVWAKDNPATYGHPGQGTAPQFGGFQLARLTKIKLDEIAYRGGPAVTQAAMTGEVSLGINPSGNFIQMKQAGKLHMLAVMAPERTPAAPDVPTLQELGYADAVVGEKFVIAAPKALDHAVAQQLAQGLKRITAAPSFATALTENDFVVKYSDGKTITNALNQESQDWSKLAKETGYTING